MKDRTRILIIVPLFFILQCKEKIELEVENENPFYMELEKGCVKKTPFQKIADGCIQTKENLLCYQYMELLKKSRLDKIFYNGDWYSSDIQSYRYLIDQFGNIRVLRGGPDRVPDDLSGHGKLQRRNDQWYYQHSCEREFCEKVELAIANISCYAGYDANIRDYILTLTLENGDFIREDEITGNKYKEITLIKVINDKPQITNGFISTKVPSILEKR
ncbi:hypothetical protein LFX15_07980 [Leptospira levettii]|uniref:hypothetical protein n=1 Tax=Leptospira levettii TaxID=2023178 RepID=UPI001EEBCD48|nr:hypothetical protein [Leptospira levettii]MCG6148222.1 hypothetical protein [Leptospira levettii]